MAHRTSFVQRQLLVGELLYIILLGHYSAKCFSSFHTDRTLKMPPNYTCSKPSARRLEKALHDHGLEKLRTVKRKADESLHGHPTKTLKVSGHPGDQSSDTTQKIRLHRTRHAAAKKSAMAIFKAGYGREMAMRVLDTMYETGTYDPVAIGLDQKPVYDWSDPDYAHLDKDTIDQIWAWQPRYDPCHQKIEVISPKSRSWFV